MSEPITNAEAAVAALGALPMPAGPQQPPFPPAPRDFEEKLRQDVARLQGLLADAVRDVHRARDERDLMRERVSEPFGCRHCGTAEQSHGRRYLGSVGVHSWERPSDEQVKDRMLARRAARFPLPSVLELDRAEEELTGVHLSLYEERLVTARLRLALESAQRGRHGRSELRARIAELETQRRADHEAWQHDLRTARREREAAAARIAKSESEEDPGRCLKVHAFSPRDGWRMICGSCDHGKDAECHQGGAHA
ncbi:hypothetical protein [Streptomyces sp. NPDC127072]|uniref:hypothetical protein n=1 Tax=Streptomyces sp. NPDC127072 TaxID=3347129 RepID=UPI0036567D51